MERLIEETPRYREVICPYIGGKEVNSSPTHDHHRYIINFRDWPLRRADLRATWQDADGEQRRTWRRDGIVPIDYPEPVAADSPELLAIVEEKVKPERLAQNDKGAKQKWWQFIRPRPELHAAIDGLDRVLVIPQTSNAQAFVLMPSNIVLDQTLIVFPFSDYRYLRRA